MKPSCDTASLTASSPNLVALEYRVPDPAIASGELVIQVDLQLQTGDLSDESYLAWMQVTQSRTFSILIHPGRSGGVWSLMSSSIYPSQP